MLSKLQYAAYEVTVSSNITYFPDWFAVYEMLPVAALSGAAGGEGATVSRLIPAAPLTYNVQKTAQVLEAVGPRAEPPSVCLLSFVRDYSLSSKMNFLLTSERAASRTPRLRGG